MAKVCVFCGKNPEIKTREHVIPKWLIESTGDPKRMIHIGSKLMDFGSFQFPACYECNNRFSELEGKVKGYFDLIFQMQSFGPNEINDILDWVDKIRVGLWLGSLAINKVHDIIDPKFFIQSRMGTADRVLFVYELTDDLPRGISFIGTDTIGFWYCPSCFTLIVNNLVLFNYSFSYLISKRAGFPFPINDTLYQTEDRKILISLENGLEKISLPLLKNILFIKPVLKIFQPIFQREILINTSISKLYETDYIKSNCLNFEKGLGSIFVDDGVFRKLCSNDGIRIYSNTQNLELKNFIPMICRQTDFFIEQCLKRKIDLSLLQKEEKLELIRTRNFIIKCHKEMTRSSHNNLKTLFSHI